MTLLWKSLYSVKAAVVLIFFVIAYIKMGTMLIHIEKESI